jgi:glycosyltransferase involved in cell wall biosynthesis
MPRTKLGSGGAHAVGVLFVLPHLQTGGAERQTLLLVGALRELGVEARIYAFEDASIPLGAPTTSSAAVVGPAGAAGRVSHEDRVRFGPLPGVRGLREYVRSTRPRVVVSRLLSGHLMTSLALRGLPVQHFAFEDLDPLNFYAHTRLGSVKRAITGRVYRGLGEAVGAPTDIIARNMQDAYGLSGLPHVLPLILEQPTNHNGQLSCDCKHGERIVMVSSLTRRKDPLAALDVLGRFRAACLTVMGDGPEREALVEQARHRNLILHMRGWVPRPVDYLHEYDALVHPSKAESFGLAMAEALSVGVPVITRDTSGARALAAVVPSGILWWDDVVDRHKPLELSEVLQAEAAALRSRMLAPHVAGLWSERLGLA